MADDMYFSPDMKALRRGRRVTKRTETCRPCLVWPKDAPELKLHGVVLNVNPYSVLVRMIDSLPPGTEVMVQLMRDDEFSEPLAEPLDGMVARNREESGGLIDHGIKFRQKGPRRPEPRPSAGRKRAPVRYPRPRMHTIDLTVGEATTRRRPGK